MAEKSLEHFLRGELKPISCQPLGKENFACRELTRVRDGEVHKMPALSSVRNEVTSGDWGIHAPPATKLADHVDFSAPKSGVTIANFPKRIASGL